MVDGGFTITRAIQSRSWPAASANLEYAAVWGTVGAGAGVPPNEWPTTSWCARVSTLLEPAGASTAHPCRLAARTWASPSKAAYVLGMGFVLDPTEAAAWIDDRPAQRRGAVPLPQRRGPQLPPRLLGVSLGHRLQRAQREADGRRYSNAIRSASTRLVKPERARTTRKRICRDDWWQFSERVLLCAGRSPALDEVLVITRVSKTVMPVRVPTGQVFERGADGIRDRFVRRPGGACRRSCTRCGRSSTARAFERSELHAVGCVRDAFRAGCHRAA